MMTDESGDEGGKGSEVSVKIRGRRARSKAHEACSRFPLVYRTAEYIGPAYCEKKVIDKCVDLIRLLHTKQLNRNLTNPHHN